MWREAEAARLRLPRLATPAPSTLSAFRASLAFVFSAPRELAGLAETWSHEERAEITQTPTAKAGMCLEINQIAKKMDAPKAGLSFRINKSLKQRLANAGWYMIINTLDE